MARRKEMERGKSEILTAEAFQFWCENLQSYDGWQADVGLGEIGAVWSWVNDHSERKRPLAIGELLTIVQQDGLEEVACAETNKTFTPYFVWQIDIDNRENWATYPGGELTEKKLLSICRLWPRSEPLAGQPMRFGHYLPINGQPWPFIGRLKAKKMSADGTVWELNPDSVLAKVALDLSEKIQRDVFPMCLNDAKRALAVIYKWGKAKREKEAAAR